VEHNSGSIVQTHTGLLELVLTTDNSEVVVAGAKDVSHLEEVCQDGGGLKSLESVLDNVGPLAEKSDEVGSVLLLEKAEVGSGELLVGEVDSSADRAQTSVGVLEVRTSVTLEGGHDVHVELVVVDSLSRHVLDHNTADTENIGNGLRVLNLRVLDLVFLHHLVHLVGNVSENVVKELDGTLSGAHTQNHTEVDVLALLGNVLMAHKLNGLEELLQVKILLRSNNVDHVVKLVLVLSVKELADISGEVKSGAILLSENDLLETLTRLARNVLGEVDQSSTVGILSESLLGENLGSLLHVLLGDLRLSRVLVVLNVETSVGLLITNNTEVSESSPQFNSLLVTIRHSSEVLSGLLIQGAGLKLSNILTSVLLLLDLGLLVRHLVVDSDVKVEKMVDRVGLESLLITPLLPGESQQTVLLTPVTKVVHSSNLPASALVQRSEETTNDGTSKVTSVERLGDVGRRELDNHSLPARVRVARVSETIVRVLSVVVALLSDRGNKHARQLVRLEEERDEGTRSSGLLNKRRLGEL